MTRLLAHQLDYLLFVEGLFLTASALMAGVLRREGGAPPWGWFALFALGQGVGQWLGLLPLPPASVQLLGSLRQLLAVGSFAALFHFGRVLERSGPETLRRGLPGALGALFAFGLLWHLAGPSASSSAAVLLCAAGAVPCVWRADKRRPGFGALALALAAYGLATAADGVLGASSLPSPTAFGRLPLVALHALLEACAASWLAWTLWRHARRARLAAPCAARDALLGRRFSAWIGVALALAVAGGWVLSERLGRFARDALARDGRALATALAHHVAHELLEEDEEAFRRAARSPELVEAVTSGQRRDLAAATAALHTFGSRTSGQACYLATPAGEPLAGAPEVYPADRGSLREVASFRKAARGELSWDAVRVTPGGRRAYWVDVPIFSPAGTVRGVFMVERSVDSLERALGDGPTLLVGPSGALFLANRAVLSLSPGPALASVTRLADGSELALAGERFLVVRQPLKDRGWSLLLLKPTRPIQAYRLFGVLFAFLACGLILALFLHSEVKRESAEAIAASEERLRTIFEGAPDGIVLFDAETGRVLLVNPAFERLLGYGRGELHGKLATRKARQRVEEQRAAGSAPGTPFLLGDDRLRRKDGSFVDVEDTGTFLRFQGRSCVVAFVRDVRERKRAEESLRLQQALLVEQKEFSENLLRGCAVAAFVLGPDHKVLFWNRACEELTLLRASDVVGTNLHWQAFYPVERPCLADFVLDGSRPDLTGGYYEHCVPSKLLPDGLHGRRWFKNLAGEDRYVVFDAAPIRNSHGELVGVIETLQDMTERQRAEEERALLAAAVEQAGEVIVISDAEGRIQYANPVFAAVTGHPVAEVIGRKHRVWKTSAPGRPREVLHAIEAGETWTGRLVSRRKDGTIYEEDATISPVRDASRKITHFVGVSRDVSKEVQLERQLAVAQKFEALGTLAGGIAHDFNNILAVIIGYAEMALDELPEGGRPRRSLEHVLSAGERARDLVRQILAFSRRPEPGPQPVRVAEIVEEALQLCRASLPGNVAIERRVAAEQGFVAADPTQLHQVVMNLCANAGQAMGERGGVLGAELDEVFIDEESPAGCLELEPGEYVRLRISDNGCGIDPNILHRIFEPFFTTKEVGEGTGMGLAVVHGIVRGAGGDVEVETRPEGGTAFTVYLPKVPAGAGAAPGPGAPEPAQGEERILFVEDDPVLRELGERLLSQLGYRVTGASGADEALARLREGADEFDLLITDQGSPGVPGLELARRIHGERPELPILLCSDYSPLEEVEALEPAGIREVLSKPVSRREYSRAIRAALCAGPGDGDGAAPAGAAKNRKRPNAAPGREQPMTTEPAAARAHLQEVEA